MADEKLAPQAGDVWIDKDGEAVFVTLTYDGRVKYAFIGSAYMSEDDVVGFADGLTLLVRDGKPYQPPAPAQVGDVITQEQCRLRVESAWHEGFARGEQAVKALLAPSGDVITVECAVLYDHPRVMVFGTTRRGAAEAAKQWTGWEHIANVNVETPKAMVAKPSLPPVTAAQA